MSTNIKETTFRHWDDCEWSGCPSHKLRVEYQNTADIFSFYIDDERVFGGDPNQIGAIIKTINRMRPIRVEIDSMMEDALDTTPIQGKEEV